LTIINPDKSSYELEGMITNKGQFIIPIVIDGNSQTGEYIIVAKYKNVEFDRTSFNVK
jgi:hypothetical protein